MAVSDLLTTSALLSVVVAGLVLLAIRAAVSTLPRPSNSPPLPPGPPAEPILGHLRVIPSYSPEYAYMKWSQEYGSDILSFKVLGQPIVVLNSVRAATDLLDKRGANYCDRPRFVLFEVMGWGKTLTFLPWGPDFRIHRRILQKSFQRSSIVKYQALQEHEAALLLKGVLANPAQWENIFRRFATAIVLGIGFGINVDSPDNPFIKVAADASYALGHGGAPAGTPVDFFPFLKSLPRFCHDRSLKFANDWRWAIYNLHDKPFEVVLALDQRDRAQSLIKDMLDQRQHQLDKGENPELSHDDIKGAAGAVFAAGQDTTCATLIVFVLNMVLHPEVQAKAQQLLDKVVGRQRLPNFEDRPQLLYIDYILQETLRWCPVSPIGIPHRSLQDDVYNGYLIPKGSFVYANARAMTHDASTYTNPDDFNPDRYVPLHQGGPGEPYPIGQFGYGRRICIGKHLAEASVWIVIASLLSTMNINKTKDANGKSVEPRIELTNGLTCHPVNFTCHMEPRDDLAVELIG
ncbi:hypothetical protein CDD82_3571 [Ophiocordyceps australis]|uniref:Cytochrome P450 n=1 Tax=Ophiocordyceps australis TaxID=1399860 RepID=A0A2C5Z633_9HYPO|nr:hypothetical protein CDD82_3571 [Ophiocordyceps australis]